MAEKIPSPSEIKTSSTTFSKKELEEIQILQEAISSITYKFGQFNLSKIRLEKQEQLLKDELSKLETKELQLAKRLSSKYGKGNLNLSTGEFTPLK